MEGTKKFQAKRSNGVPLVPQRAAQRRHGAGDFLKTPGARLGDFRRQQEAGTLEECVRLPREQVPSTVGSAECGKLHCVATALSEPPSKPLKKECRQRCESDCSYCLYCAIELFSFRSIIVRQNVSFWNPCQSWTTKFRIFQAKHYDTHVCEFRRSRAAGTNVLAARRNQGSAG